MTPEQVLEAEDLILKHWDHCKDRIYPDGSIYKERYTQEEMYTWWMNRFESYFEETKIVILSRTNNIQPWFTV